MDEFEKDLMENKRKNSEYADYFTLQNKDNRVLILTNPIGFSEAYGIGIAYQDCGYGAYATRRYKCYVKDLVDNKIKIFNMSYTVATALHALSQGQRTKFDNFPIPYVINFKTENAKTKEIKVDVIADEDMEITDEDKEILAKFDPILEIIERLKVAQKKKVESSDEMQEKIKEFVAKREAEKKARADKKNKDATKETVDNTTESDVNYPDEDIKVEDITF